MSKVIKYGGKNVSVNLKALNTWSKFKKVMQPILGNSTERIYTELTGKKVKKS